MTLEDLIGYTLIASIIIPTIIMVVAWIWR